MKLEINSIETNDGYVKIRLHDYAEIVRRVNAFDELRETLIWIRAVQHEANFHNVGDPAKCHAVTCNKINRTLASLDARGETK